MAGLLKITIVTCLVLHVATAVLIPSTNPNCIGSCPSNNDYNVHLKHSDPQKFCQCVWGKPVEMPCAPGTWFNEHLQVCDWFAGSATGAPTAAPTAAPTTASTATPTAAPTAAPTVPSGSGWVAPTNPDCLGLCPIDNYHNGGLVKHLKHTNPTMYCRCDWGDAIVMPCAPGTKFDPTLEVCVHL